MTIKFPEFKWHQFIPEKSAFPSDAEVTEFFSRIREMQISSLPDDRAAYTPLHIACGLGLIRVCENLCASGELISEERGCGISPFQVAVHLDQLEWIDFFFEHGSTKDKSFFLYSNVIKNRRQLFDHYWTRSCSDTRSQLIFLLMTENHLNLALEQFQKLTTVEMITVLRMIFFSDHEIYFNFFWEKLPLTDQEKCLDEAKILQYCISSAQSKKGQIALDLLPHASLESQLKILKLAIADENLFISCLSHVSPLMQNYRDDEGFSWLHHAIILNQKKIIAHLLAMEYDVRTIAADGDSPLMFAICRVEQLGMAIVEELAVKDAGFTSDLNECRLFGHRFSLKGALFEGLSIQGSHKTAPQEIIVSLTEAANVFPFLNIPVRRFSNDRIEKIIETFHHSHNDAESLLERSQTKWALIQCGWEGQAVCCLLYKDKWIKINTRRFSSPVVEFYTIGNPDLKARKRVILTLIDHHFRKADKNKGSHYFNKTLNEELALTLQAWDYSDQITGHSPWEANLKALQVLLLLQELEETSGEIFDKGKIEAADKSILKDFFLWEAWDKRRSLFLANMLMRKYAHLFNVQQIYAQAIETCIREFDPDSICDMLIFEPTLKDWQDPRTHVSLIRWAYDKKLIKLFSHLIQLKSDLSLPDHNGETIHNDVLEFPQFLDNVLNNAEALKFTPEEIQQLVDLYPPPQT